MKKYRLLIAAAVLSTTTPILSGCAAMTAVSAISSVSGVFEAATSEVKIPLKVKKGYAVFLTAAVGANVAAEAAVDNKLLTPGSPRAIWVADRLKELDVIKQAAAAAYRVEDAKTLEQKVAVGNEIVAALAPFTGALSK